MVFFLLPTTMLMKKHLLSKNKSNRVTDLGHFYYRCKTWTPIL